MDMDFSTPFFPKQAIPDSQKDKNWYKQNIETGVSLVNYKYTDTYRADLREKVSNKNLYNDIVDPIEVESAINPYNLSGKFPDTYRNYPVANSNLNLLFGEERKRIFQPISYVINPDAINSELDVVTQKFNELLIDTVTSAGYDEDQTKKAISDFDKWRKFTYQDQHERMSNQVIQYVLNSTEIREHWSKCFEDLLIMGEEIMSIDVIGGSLVIERLNPIDVHTFRSADSYKIEDSDWICISRFIPLGMVVDAYHEYLTKADKAYLDDIYMLHTSGSKMFPNGQLQSETWDVNKTLEFVGLDGNKHFGDNRLLVTQNRNYDDQGNVRVTRVLWKGQRKIGVLEYIDDDGTTQKKYVPEQYKPNPELGEKVKWEYISEWYEGTKIGDDIYLKYGPRPIQFRDPDNPSICHPGIVGNILNTNSSRAKSLMSYMKPYQLLYNFFMYRLQQDIMKYQGHIARFNLATKPDKWSVEKVMFYMQQFGIYVEDPFNEGQEGAATGKLAGGLGHNPGSMQIGDYNLIQMNIQMLEFLENRMADISGVTPQRKGAISNRETVGGVERSVMQSSNNTEKYFGLHDNFRLRVLRTVVETAKIAWKDKKEKRIYVLDDGTKGVLDFDGSQFIQGTYGIATTSSSDATNMMNELKQLGQAYLQNGGSLLPIVDIWTTKDPNGLRRKLEQYDEEMKQQQQDQLKSQEQMQQQQIQSAQEMEAARMEHERMLKELELNNKIQVEAMKIEAQQEQTVEDNSEIDLEKLRVQEEKIKNDLRMNEAKLRETTRHNIATEQISKVKASQSKSKK